MRRPLVVAHRGGSALGPENTLAACEQACRFGVDAVEVDVRLTADGVPVLLHDATLDRTTDGRGPVAAQPLASLRQLDATVAFRRGHFGREPPPTLAEVLALLRHRAAVHVELKGEPAVPPALVQAVVALLHDLGLENTAVVLSFDWTALGQVRRVAPRTAVGALASTWPTGSAWQALRVGGMPWLGLRYTALRPARAAAVQQAGLRLGVWTVNRLPSLRRSLRLGVDAITTDRPDRLLALLASQDNEYGE